MSSEKTPSQQTTDANKSNNNSSNRKWSASAPLHDGGDSAGDTGVDGEERYVLALDVGTTTMRGHVYDRKGRITGSSSVKLVIEQLKPGWFEIDPFKLFEDAKTVLRDCINAAGITASQVSSLGIATQRGTFLTWDRETGEPFHQLISWQDLRAWEDVMSWNSSLTMRMLNSGARLAHFFTRQNRHKAASVLTFSAKQVTLRLKWVLDNVPEVRKRACEDQAMFGCIETWLLWKLTKGKLHATDFSCASSTGIFDPYSVEWSPIVTGLVNIPRSILPEIRDTSGDFGETDADIFGVPIPIRAIVADQQGAMFGQCCFNLGDIKCTVGTGTFVDINTGSKPHASMTGLYPLVGWKIGKEMTFVAEGHSADTGNVMEWARRIGLFEDVSETSEMAASVKDSGGVCFVPAFSGIQQPINDDSATTSLMGVTLATTKAHIVRAMLEALAFRFKALYETIISETRIPLSSIRVDGGVCNNDFLMQLMCDVVHQPLDRSAHPDMTSLGAAFLAGLASGVWQSKEQLRAMRQSNQVFEPKPSWSSIRESFHLWEKAQARSMHWYQENNGH